MKAWKQVLAILLAVIIICGTSSIGEIIEADWSTSPNDAVKSWRYTGSKTVKTIVSRVGETLRGLTLEAHAATYTGKCGNDVTWNLNTDTGLLSISGTGEMDYHVWKSPWEDYKASIRTVKIGNGVTNISSSAFSGCTSLTSATIGNSVTRIDYCAFYGCTELASVTIPESVTSLGWSIFEGCKNLSHVTFNSIDCSSDAVEDYQHPVFAACPSLKSVTIGEKVKTIPPYLFHFCTGLLNVTIPNSVTSIGEGAFWLCRNLESILISDNIMHIGSRAFEETAYSRDANNWKDGVLYVGKHLIKSEKDISGSITLLPGTRCIGDYAFTECRSITEMIIPEGATSIGYRAFWCCSHLARVKIPDTVSEIGEWAFENCSSLTEVTIPNRVKHIKDSTFQFCNSLTNVALGDGITSIGSDAFYYCPKLTNIHVPSSVTRIGTSAFHTCNSSFYICNHSAYCYAKWYADANEVPFRICQTHESSDNDVYNLGEETYSFENYGDEDSPFGHCFGMAITSSGYYLGKLDKSIIRTSNDSPLYSLQDTSVVRDPICHYIQVQGTAAEGAEYQAMVAGGSIDLNGTENISADWKSCVDYVKNHQYDNKGSLNVGTWYLDDGGHAVNFLYYMEVNGEPRIYVYDNNYPQMETYYYMGEDNYVHEGPEEVDFWQIEGIDLMDVEVYFPIADKYEPYRYIFAGKDTISVEGASVCKMKCARESGAYYMYEIPKGIKEVTITPLVENAHFQYLEKTYAFDGINNQTYGVLKVADENATYGSLTTFSVYNAPEKVSTIAIQNYVQSRTEDYRTTLTFTSISTDVPFDATTHWYINESDKGSGESYTVTEAKNSFSVQAKLIGRDGRVIAESEVERVIIKTGFFARLKAFFRALFGRLPKVVQEYLEVENTD